MAVDRSLKTTGSFKHYCTCGGYAWDRNGRPQAQPHMTWCPQYEEYAAWWAKRFPGVNIDKVHRER